MMIFPRQNAEARLSVVTRLKPVVGFYHHLTAIVVKNLHYHSLVALLTFFFKRLV